MPRFTILCIVLFLVGLLFSLMGMAIPALALFPAPVAIYWVLGEHRKSLWLVAIAAMIAVLVSFAYGLSPTVWLTFGAAAALGIPMALVIMHRVQFGKAVLLVALAGTFWVISVMLLNWEASRESTEIFIASSVAQIEETAVENRTSMEQTTADYFRWLNENWVYLVFGIVFGFVFIATALALAVVSLWLRIKAPNRVYMFGSLKDCRPPESLVWLAILLALLWMIDQWWWHTVPLRMITWNAAIGLTMVYLFNGFSILLSALHQFQVPPLVYGFIIMSVLILGSTLGLHPVFLGFGFFDTWFKFRKRFRILAKAQKKQKKNSNISNDE